MLLKCSKEGGRGFARCRSPWLFVLSRNNHRIAGIIPTRSFAGEKQIARHEIDFPLLNCSVRAVEILRLCVRVTEMPVTDPWQKKKRRTKE